MPHIITEEPLAQMIRSITLHKRTGVLHVERLSGKSLEQGEMHFEGGCLVRARTERERGKAALQYISEWKQITCTFESMSRAYPATTANLASSTDRGEHTQAREVSASLPQTDRLTRAAGTRDTEPIQNETISGVFPARERNTRPLSPRQAEVALSANARLSMPSSLTDAGDQPLILRGSRLETYTPLPLPLPSRSVQRWTTHQTADFGVPAMPSKPPLTPRLGPLPGEEVLPGRMAVFKVLATVSTAQAIGQMARRARIVFILLDGRRTVQDIARLTHQTEAEVEQTLVDLAQRGYIQYMWG